MYRRSLDELWNALKNSAHRLASNGSPAPSLEECEEEVRRLVAEILGPEATVPPEAFAFYTRELCGMSGRVVNA
ncbi:MAG: hypothetical protein M3N13_00980 [Candidatus Eremiobacteraeota bacterium]|nr:hypothetical protein [Candidatus Eremiobacteraeota bacterium]